MTAARADAATRDRPRPRLHYSLLIATAIRRLVNEHADGSALPVQGLAADQPQANHAYGAQQLRLVLPGCDGEETVYRLIIAPADAPISIGGVPADRHFAGPLRRED